MAGQLRIDDAVGRGPNGWTRALALGMVAVALVLILVVANQIGGILIAQDLRDEYQQLVDDARSASGQLEGATASGGARAVGVGVGSGIGELVDKADLRPVPAGERNVSIAPEMPPAADRSAQAIVDVTFEVVETVSTIDPSGGARHETWGYRLVDGPDGTVTGTPGPAIRARVGDVLRFTIVNPDGNAHPHNVDLHAVTGQGGGAVATTVAPGETRTIEARLLHPGFFMYHCAYGDVPAHIAHGMFGGILVDPETPLPDVDHEWYVVQSEYYLGADDGRVAALDRAALRDEAPTHVVFNGAVGALTDDDALQMRVGERSRIYFVNAGLNLISSLHPIGSHWDLVYPEAALSDPTPVRGSQTTLVPAGGGTIVELVGLVPETVILVDHALSRAFDKGAIGQIVVSGADDPEIFAAVAPARVDRAGAPSSSSRSPRPEGDAAPVAAETVSIEPGSGVFQQEDAPDEFGDVEEPADYGINVLEIAVGDTVTWRNDDTIVHTVTAVDGSFDSGLVASGQTWSYTFDEAGEFEYFCTPHPWMRARVVVTR